VQLTTALDARGRTQAGTFNGGVFVVAQKPADRGYVELRLAGPSLRCPRARSRDRVGAARSRSRRLWGRDRGGRFRTRGSHGVATVRGTRWLTEDRCDGTLFQVRQGKVEVRDLHTRKTVLVTAGGRYLARAR
jgi:hypothetical protein